MMFLLYFSYKYYRLCIEKETVKLTLKDCLLQIARFCYCFCVKGVVLIYKIYKRVEFAIKHLSESIKN